MANPVIKIENLGKRYFITHQTGARYKTFRDSIADTPRRLINSMFSNDRDGRSPKEEEFWALKEVNFNINEGARLGIIGRNGAGKSTLLKLLSRITEPTTGRITMRGRVASLLEVGTGFHLELTGRENIFLNGAILGMGRNEIKKKFDEIVAFAEVEQFLDTPVKRYSSGMFVRLAFAVAANLEPEILIVDEVLAVGDLKFRQKCMTKMEDISTNEGRTVIFVSHDMSSIRQLCNEAILLEKGQLKIAGTSEEVAHYYESKLFGDDTNTSATVIRSPTPNHYHFRKVELRDAQNEITGQFKAGDQLNIHLWSSGKAPQDSFTVEFILTNERGVIISYGNANPVRTTYYKASDEHFVCKLGPLPLTTGKYTLSFVVRVWGMETWDHWQNAVNFSIVRSDFFNTGHDIPSGPGGDFVINQEWTAAE